MGVGAYIVKVLAFVADLLTLIPGGWAIIAVFLGVFSNGLMVTRVSYS